MYQNPNDIAKEIQSDPMSKLPPIQKAYEQQLSSPTSMKSSSASFLYSE
jgi:hypothetical protein